MSGQTYEHGDDAPVTPLDDRIADLARKLCDEYRQTLDQFCCDPRRRPVLLALEAMLQQRGE